MAIEFQEVPQGQMDLGIFNLPPEFDSTKFAAEWVKKGADVSRMQMRQPILGMSGVTADGWQVWKAPSKAMATVQAKGGEYILMFRPKEIQDQVNALYGNVSKSRMLREKSQGVTARADERADAGGILTTERLRESGMRDEEADGNDGIVLNNVNVQRAQVPSLDITTPDGGGDKE